MIRSWWEKAKRWEWRSWKS